MIAQDGRMLENKEVWTRGIKINGAAIQGSQVYRAPINNLIPPGFIGIWESGQYGTNGEKAAFAQRIRLIDLLPIPPGERLYFNTYAIRDSIRFVIRAFNASQVFMSSTGEVANGYVSSFTANVAYLGVTLFESPSSSLLFADYQRMFENGEIKPYIGVA